MFKKLLILPLAALSFVSASAQFKYTVTNTTAPYTALTGATSLNGTLIWDEEILVAPMPFTWTIDGNKPVAEFKLALEIPGVIADTNNFGSIDGFFLSDVDITDRGALAGTVSRSPISYLTTGTAPNRIFKVEIANAGFFVELGDHLSMDDSLSMQVWVYEGSNIVEYHYGPSRITFPSEYFGFGGNGPLTGYGKGVNIVNLSTGDFYFLTGNPAAPTLDSVTLPLSSFPTGLAAWPASGQVYRYTPKGSAGVGIATSPLAANRPDVKLYPSVASSLLNVRYNAATTQPADYQVLNATGSVVASGQLHRGTQHLDISALASGNYYLQVKSADAAGSFGFVKQ